MKKYTYFALCALLLGFSACSSYPDYDANEVERQVVAITQYDLSTNFTKPHFNTFSIADSMCVLDEKGKKIYVKNDLSDLIIAQAKLNMKEFGYTYVDKSAVPDLAINVSGIKSSKYQYSYYWGFYDPYYWGDYWGWYYYYPVYPMLTSVYTSGSVLLEMVDIKDANIEEKKLKVVWVGIIRGIMNYKHTDAEIIGAVNTCFKQTPVAPFNLNAPSVRK
ncbi:MAG: DUF4136 domain-containing protein [Bacteroidales bacterium]